MIRCGTYDGVNDHNRAGSPVCADCRLASAVYMRQLRRRVDLGMPTRNAAETPRWKTRPELDAGLRASA